MRIPKTTNEKPYIEFRFNKKGKITLTATSTWWGGINAGFICTDGTEGNTSYLKSLKTYIAAFKKRKIKEIEKEILILQKKKQNKRKIT